MYFFNTPRNDRATSNSATFMKFCSTFFWIRLGLSDDKATWFNIMLWYLISTLMARGLFNEALFYSCRDQVIHDRSSLADAEATQAHQQRIQQLQNDLNTHSASFNSYNRFQSNFVHPLSKQNIFRTIAAGIITGLFIKTIRDSASHNVASASAALLFMVLDHIFIKHSDNIISTMRDNILSYRNGFRLPAP